MKFFLLSSLGLFAVANSMKCESGSIPDAKNVCIHPKFIEGCFTYATEQTCSQCNFNYKLDQTTGLCSFNSNTTEPCCLQSEGKQCKQCNRGMSLVDGSCVQTQSLGCLEKAVSGQCLNCSSDFVLEGGRCRQGIRNCKKYANPQKTICQACDHSYSLAANSCLKNKILGCKSEENGACITCFEPFKPFDGQCDIKNCKDYNDFGCESCQCGYFITKKMTCQKVEEGCVRYQRGVCSDCFPPFILQGTVCSIDGCKGIEGNKCTKCNEGYKLDNGACSLPNCLRGKNGKCDVCQDGFNYNNGECISSSTKYVFSS